MPTAPNQHPIAAYRERHGLSLAQLGELCDPPLHKSQLQRIESGQRKPSFDQIAAIVAACKGEFTADDLIRHTPKSVAA